jgi:GDP-L-fucose synthase
MKKNSKIYVSGHNGLVGSAIVRKLKLEGFANITMRTHTGLDLIRRADVEAFFAKEKPDYVFHAAAQMGGLQANIDSPADFIYANTAIALNVIHSAFISGVKKLLFIGSSWAYPKCTTQPIKEEALMDGLLEKTEEAYGVAKIAGIKLCEYYNRQYGANFISCMPGNILDRMTTLIPTIPTSSPH